VRFLEIEKLIAPHQRYGSAFGPIPFEATFVVLNDTRLNVLLGG
jgi:hypothetical protein